MLKEFTHLFMRHTSPSRRHLTPEIVLRLITPSCQLWSSPVEESPFIDPFWGFYWPGGQATARYILDNPELVKNRKVLDVGCGCGAGSIAAATAKAKKVIANDIDPYALIATRINAGLNNIEIEIDVNDFIGSSCDDFDAILIGDMFYDEEFAKVLFDWLNKLTMNDKMVIIGDPGRHGLTASRRSQMTQLAKYNLPKETREENHGLTEASVWMLNKS